LSKRGYVQKDLVAIICLKSRSNKVLNRERTLSLEIIRQIH
jgi:antitoxin component HigA of HigAB toxin-antitoxin module